jgi:Tfp pilus assembly protein PilF
MFAGFLNLQATIFSHTNKTAALVTLERALNLNSINPDTHALLRNLASGVIADPPDQNEFTVDKLFTSAQKQIQSEELDLAYSNLKKALYLQPESLELRLELAQLLSYGGYGDLALLELQNARTLHPNSAQVDALAAYLSTQSATPKKTLVQ